jgi:hypothetical protein
VLAVLSDLKMCCVLCYGILCWLFFRIWKCAVFVLRHSVLAVLSDLKMCCVLCYGILCWLFFRISKCAVFCVTAFCAGCSSGSENVLCFVLRHSVLAVLSDLKINIYEVEFPHPRSHSTSKWKPNYNIFCHMLLIQYKVNNTSPYLELLRNSRTRSTSIRFS